MKRYWFYGTMPNQTVKENELTEEQKKIIELETERMSRDNYDRSWIGFCRDDGWDFMRHGFEVIFIKEQRGNVARQQLKQIIDNKYKG
jgi:hypothetical protein